VRKVVHNEEPSEKVTRATVTLPAWLDALALELGRSQGLNTRTKVLQEALLRYVKQAQRELFDAAMAKMARDPHLREDLKGIDAEFAAAESDGLSEGSSE